MIDDIHLIYAIIDIFHIYRFLWSACPRMIHSRAPVRPRIAAACTSTRAWTAAMCQVMEGNSWGSVTYGDGSSYLWNYHIWENKHQAIPAIVGYLGCQVMVVPPVVIQVMDDHGLVLKQPWWRLGIPHFRKPPYQYISDGWLDWELINYKWRLNADI